MQLENIMTSYKKTLIENGFLDIHLSELYPDIFQELQDKYNQLNLLNRLNSIRVDSMIPKNITKEVISESFSELFFNPLDLRENNILKHDENHPHGKLQFYHEFNKIDFPILTQLKNKLVDLSITNHVAQSWVEGTLSFGGDLFLIVQKLIKSILLDFYSDTTTLEETSNPFKITCFQKGDLIVKHRDSNQSNFKCVVLLYLSTEYQDGFGGELMLESNYKIKPEFGNLVILDFTDGNNVEHEVIKIEEDYYRLAITTFISNK